MSKTSSLVVKQLEALIEGETNSIANLSNASALLNEFLTDINWVGFYLFDQASQQLVLGPFQGKVACVRINPGSGVCGTAFDCDETVIVENVHEFPGHIVCDAASNSEIVVPLRNKQGQTIGVLDIDSPLLNRFNTDHQEILEEFVQTLSQVL